MKFPHYKLEAGKLAQGFTAVIGCDEAGRGSLAGPVVAGAVILNPAAVKNLNDWYSEINDSKKLSPVKRFTLEKLLRQHAIAWGIGAVTPAVIDQINIHQANLLAMKRAVAALQKKISHGTLWRRQFVLVDGRFIIPNLDDAEQEAIIAGDSLSLSIAAASIIAKTYRDRLMIRLDKQLPSYGFDQHKGYGTAQHLQMIRQHGPSAAHRRTFLAV
jgi:ribonuclease HII